MAEAKKLGGDLYETVAGAYRQMILARDYPTARALMQRASADAPAKKSLMLVTAAMLVRVQKDRPPAPWTEPQRLVQEALRRLIVEPGAESRIKPLYAPIARAVHRRPPHREMALQLRKVLDKAGFRGAAGVDLLRGFSTSTVNKTKWGARVTVASAFLPPGWRPLRAFVARRGKGWRLLELAGRSETLAAEALRLLAAGDVDGARQWMTWAADLTGGTGNFMSQAVAAVWDKHPHDRAHIEWLAAALIANSEMAGDAVGPLQACLDAEPDNVGCGRALEVAGVKLKNADLIRRGAPAVLGKQPQPWQLAASAQAVAIVNGQWTDLERLARAELAKNPGDISMTYNLARALCGQGNGVNCNKALHDLTQMTAASPMFLNEWAWQSLVIGEHGDEVLTAAQTIARRDGSAGVLNTLAAVQAARGEVEDARSTLLRGIEAGNGQPDEADWLVQGRIAQDLGYDDTARTMYGRVAHDWDDGINSYALAQRWLSEMAAAPAAAP